MAILDKLTKATQDVVRGTKDLTDTARLNSLIADEQKQIAALYSQIGKLYYETEKHDAQTAIGKLCLTVDASNERILKYNDAIRQIKGTKRCLSCGADIPIASTFCGVCGSKVEVTAEQSASPDDGKNICTSCGAELPDGVAFCTSCGQKQ